MNATITEPITLERVRTIAKELVAENPDRTNNGACLYLTEDGEPNCIAAHIFVRLGATTEDLAPQEGCAAKFVVSRLGLAGVDSSVENYLSYLQRAADGSSLAVEGLGAVPWGRALDRTEASVGRFAALVAE